jgi:hypothetical protein
MGEMISSTNAAEKDVHKKPGMLKQTGLKEGYFNNIILCLSSFCQGRAII